MPFTVTPDALKGAARTLARLVEDRGGEAPSHGESLDMMARLFGHRDWNTLLGTQDPPPENKYVLVGMHADSRLDEIGLTIFDTYDTAVQAFVDVALEDLDFGYLTADRLGWMKDLIDVSDDDLKAMCEDETALKEAIDRIRGMDPHTVYPILSEARIAEHLDIAIVPHAPSADIQAVRVPIAYAETDEGVAIAGDRKALRERGLKPRTLTLAQEDIEAAVSAAWHSRAGKPLPQATEGFVRNTLTRLAPETPLTLPVRFIKEGDRVDLANDPFADPSGDVTERIFQFEYALVADVTIETPDCVAIGIDGYDRVGFPTAHELPTLVYREDD